MTAYDRLLWLLERLTFDLDVRPDHNLHDDQFRTVHCCGAEVCITCESHTIVRGPDDRWEHQVLPPSVAWSPFCRGVAA